VDALKIKVLVPVAADTWNKDVERLSRAAADNGTEIFVENVTRGPVSIESMYDEAWAAMPILEGVAQAAREGYDAVIVYCFGNPAIEAAKEMAAIPVIGIGEAGQVVAMPLGDRLGIISTVDGAVPRHWRKAQTIGTASKVVSIRPLNIPVVEYTDKEKVRQRAFGLVRKMIEEDGVDVIVLGCGSLTSLGPEIQAEFNLPVIIPAAAAVKLAELYVRLGIAQSKRAYAPPPEKERI